MSDFRKPAKVYVELDCLLDTRFATLEAIDPEKAAYILFDGYHIRRVDKWDGIDQEEFHKRYKERNLYTLSKAKMTRCFELINEVGFEIAKDLMESPKHSRIDLYVNTYPYVLDEEELTQLDEALKIRIKAPFNYHYILVPPEDVTVRYVHDNYYVMIMYHFSEWLEMHLKEFQTCFLHEVTLLAPRVNPVNLPNPDDIKELQETNIEGLRDEFDVMERLAMVFIALILVDVSYFSMIAPDYADLLKDEIKTKENE